MSRIASSRVSTPSEPVTTIGYSPPAASGGIATSSVTEPALSGVAVTEWTTKPPPRRDVELDRRSRLSGNGGVRRRDRQRGVGGSGRAWLGHQQGAEGERGTDTARGAAA
jgi:hypothetical protein